MQKSLSFGVLRHFRTKWPLPTSNAIISRLFQPHPNGLENGEVIENGSKSRFIAATFLELMLMSANTRYIGRHVWYVIFIVCV